MQTSESSSFHSDLRIIFMGTPDFAVASLDALLKAGFNIVCVITAPDKPAGRGMKITTSAVKQYALEKGLNILQPEKLKNSTFITQLKAFQADLQIVVAFRMLPELVWNMPSLGTINLHGSLLPQYRGAAPIHWAVINGEKETGVTTFKLKHEIDTGDILLQKSFSIEDNETTGEVHDRMKEVGASLLVETVKGIANHTLHTSPQSLTTPITQTPLQHAPKIFTENCHISWNEPVNKVHNLIRGLSPFPGALTILDDKMLKVFSGRKEIIKHSYTPGAMLSDTKSFLKFACIDGFIHILDLQMEGKKRMLIQDFLRGYRIKDATE